MSRNTLLVLAVAVAAAAIATTVTLVVTHNEAGRSIATASPAVATSSPEVTSVVTTPSPGASTTATPAPSSKSSGSPTPAPTPTPHASKPASGVDCNATPKFCSDTQATMSVTDGKLDSVSSSTVQTDYSGAASVTMVWKIYKTDNKTEAAKGDTVGSIHAAVTVKNNTSKTFVFPNREVALDIFKDGKLYDRLVTHGPGFEMTPGGSMDGTFDRPIVSDGSYSWRAKTWYFTK